MGTDAFYKGVNIMYRIDVYKDATNPALIARLYVKREEVETRAAAFQGYYITVNKVKE